MRHEGVDSDLVMVVRVETYARELYRIDCSRVSHSPSFLKVYLFLVMNFQS